MTPTVGRIVNYTLSGEDVDEIDKRRIDFLKHVGSASYSDTGYQAHYGTKPEVGMVLPMIVTYVEPAVAGLVSGQVFLDGNDTLWVRNVSEGMGPDEWHWPQRQ